MEPNPFAISPSFLRLLAATRQGGLPPALQLAQPEASLGDGGGGGGAPAAPPAGPAAEPGGGVTGILQRLFAGRPSAAFQDPAEQEQAFQDSMFRAGLRMVLESGGPESGSVARILARGMLEGQQTYSQFELAALKRAALQGRQALLQRFATADNEELGGILREMIANGMTEEVKTALDVLDQMQPELESIEGIPAGATDDRPRIGGFDPSTGQVTFPENAPFAEPAPVVEVDRDRVTGINPQTGQPEFMYISPTRGPIFTGIVDPAQLKRDGSEDGGLTMQERLNARLGVVAFMANDELNTIDAALGGLDPRPHISRMGGVLGAVARAASTDEQQTAVATVLQFLNPTVRFLTGAQMNEQEALRYMIAMTPQFGERDAVIKQKRRARAAMVAAMAGDPAAFGATLDQVRANMDAILAENGLTIAPPGSVTQADVDRVLSAEPGALPTLPTPASADASNPYLSGN